MAGYILYIQEMCPFMALCIQTMDRRMFTVHQKIWKIGKKVKAYFGPLFRRLFFKENKIKNKNKNCKQALRSFT